LPIIFLDLINLSDGQIFIVISEAIGARINKRSRSITCILTCSLCAGIRSDSSQLSPNLVGISLSEEMVRVMQAF